MYSRGGEWGGIILCLEVLLCFPVQEKIMFIRPSPVVYMHTCLITHTCSKHTPLGRARGFSFLKRRYSYGPKKWPLHGS